MSAVVERIRRPRFSSSNFLDRMPENWFAQILLSPVYLVVLVGLGIPLVYSFYVSFLNLQLTRLNASKFVGIDNYLNLFSDRLFLTSVQATVTFTIGATVLAVGIAVGLALLLSQPIRGRAIYLVILLVPWAIPPVVNAWMWFWMYDPNFGAANALLKGAGIIEQYVNWFGNTNTAFFSLIIAQTWKSTPFLVLLLLAKLLDIHKNLYRAAEIDGANPWQRFRYITLPSLRQTLLVVIILQTMWNLQAFDLIFVLTKGQPNDSTTVLNYLVYLDVFQHKDIGYGAAAAWILTGLVAVLTLLYLRFFRERGEDA